MKRRSNYAAGLRPRSTDYFVCELCKEKSFGPSVINLEIGVSCVRAENVEMLVCYDCMMHKVLEFLGTSFEEIEAMEDESNKHYNGFTY